MYHRALDHDLNDCMRLRVSSLRILFLSGLICVADSLYIILKIFDMLLSAG